MSDIRKDSALYKILKDPKTIEKVFLYSDGVEFWEFDCIGYHKVTQPKANSQKQDI